MMDVGLNSNLQCNDGFYEGSANIRHANMRTHAKQQGLNCIICFESNSSHTTFYLLRFAKVVVVHKKTITLDY